MSYTNYKIDELAQDFSEDAWNAFHNAEINDQDDLYDYRHQWIDNKVIYTHDCKKYIDDLNYDIFEEHDLFGRAENWSQAAYSAIYDALDESDDTVSWYDMEQVLQEATN